jgi:hypothetical protein
MAAANGVWLSLGGIAGASNPGFIQAAAKMAKAINGYILGMLRFEGEMIVAKVECLGFSVREQGWHSPKPDIER